MSENRSFMLRFHMAPGDVLVLSSLVRDLYRNYRGRYKVAVDTNFPAIWRHNPYITKFSSTRGVTSVPMTYSVNNGQKSRVHFITDFYRHFRQATRINVPVLESKPDLHLSDEEKAKPLISGRYWIVVPGGKSDMTTKIWSQLRWQQTAHALRDLGIPCVQEGATKKGHFHPPLDDVLNLVGMTSVRDLIRNIYHADGVICGITFPMHVAAALERPCVVIAGGREAPWWEEYSNAWGAFGESAAPVRVPHRFLHTLGQLPCCASAGCWKRRTVPLADNAKHNKSLCQLPVVDEAGQPIPECLRVITSEHVVESVRQYYRDGYLPPISWSREELVQWRKDFFNGRNPIERYTVTSPVHHAMP